MRIARWTILVALVSMALAACPMPIAVVPPDGAVVAAIDGGTGQKQSQPTITVDVSRGQVVYVSESGNRIDVASEDPDGAVVACVAPVGMAVDKSQPVAGPSLSVAGGTSGSTFKAIIIGMRSDGAPGAWAVQSDNTILSIGSISGGKHSSRLEESDDHEGRLHAAWGWTYKVTGIAENGKMIVGIATNEKGFKRGKWSVEPGTTVGVYWNVRKDDHQRPRVTAARVIGVLQIPRLHADDEHDGHHVERKLLKRFASLKFFMLDWYSTYLVAADSVSYDAAKALYVVPGTDQDGAKAVATIDAQGSIAITAAPQNTDKPDLAVVSVQAPGTPQRMSDLWTVGATLQNLGAVPSGAGTLEYRVGSSATPKPTDPLLVARALPAIPAGGTYVDVSALTYSISEPGTHWVFATAILPAGTETQLGNNSLGVAVAIIYDRVMIDTYRPNPLMSANADTFVSLYGPQGTAAAPIAEADGGNLTYPVGYARIDYSGGLPPGTYYVRVQGGTPAADGPYAFRALVSPNAPPNEYAAGDYFDVVADPDPYEPDDAVLNGLPTKPVAASIGAAINRFLTTGGSDVDWFVLTLP
jgi:hypothetical protein